MTFAISLGFILGALTWCALEYILHRFVGHKSRGKSLFTKEHRRHHADGNYFAPHMRKVVNVSPPMLGVGLVGGLVFGWGIGIAYATGLSIMYLTYEVFHKRLHTHPPKTRYGRWARRHHFHHHFVNTKANHGVTTSLMDRFTKTLEPVEQIPVPERLAMSWLLDPETGDVAAPYQADYRLLRLGATKPRPVRKSRAA